MPIVGILLLFFVLAAFALLWRLLPDPWSPDKMMLGFVGVFFSDIYLRPYSAAYVVIFVEIVLAIVLGVLANEVGQRRHRGKHDVTRRGIDAALGGVGPMQHIVLWVLSVPAVLAQFYIIAQMGGLEGYYEMIGYRQREFRGLGHITLTINSLKTVNLVYFALLVCNRQSKGKDWLLYAGHTAIFLVVAFLSTSRGTLLVNFVLMAFILHYGRWRIRLTTMGALAGILLTAASILGVMREGYRWTAGGLITGLSDPERGEWFRLSWMRYGLTPLELVLERTEEPLQFGMTYLTAVTNFVPRAIWPNKPDSGGVVLTELYASNSWGGLSFLATGLVPEAVMNFGVIGVPLGVFGFSLLVVFALRWRSSMLRRLERADVVSSASLLSASGIVFWSVASLSVAEFTNVFLSTTLNLLTIFGATVALQAVGRSRASS